MRAWLLIWLQSAVLVYSQVLDGYFVDLESNWTSKQSVGNSLVSTPELTFLNDTATSFQWTLRTNDLAARLATNFNLEMSFSLYSDDFVNYASIVSQVPEDFSNNSFSDFYTVAGLQPATDYRFRICPEFATGRGVCSDPLSVTTLPVAVNYWEPILSRRLSLAASGRGFTNPVVDRPHLDPGVEVFESRTSDDPTRYSDPVTSEAPVLPSGRRGHSLSLVDDAVYMFGGRTNGYSCATVYKDTLDLGNTDSGRDIYPCVHFQGEVNELWSFDVSTYQWTFLNTSKYHTPPLPSPPPREQHSSVVIDRDLYYFGGKTRFFEQVNGTFIYTQHSDHVYGDLWKLSVERARGFSLYHNYTHDIPDDSVYFATIMGPTSTPTAAPTTAPSAVPSFSTAPSTRPSAVPSAVPSASPSAVPTAAPSTSAPSTTAPSALPAVPSAAPSTLFTDAPTTEYANPFDAVTPRNGLCIDKAIVKVKLYHPCLTQVRATIQGPGSLSGSANYFSPAYGHEIVLFSALTTNGSGCIGGVQSFVFDDDSNRRLEDYNAVYQGVYQPQADLNSGYLISWAIDFTSSPCYRSYAWTDLSVPAAGSAPVPRYGAKSLSHEQSLFVYGGRDANDTLLHDLHRYDANTRTWTSLTPLNFNIAQDPSSSVGANFLLTSWGLVRYSGYYRQPTMSTSYGNYDSSVEVQDPVTLRWRELLVDTEGGVLPWDATFGRSSAPASRYLGASVFIPSHTLSSWRTGYDHHQLYDLKNSSSRTNYAGSIADSIFVFGGFDGSTGPAIDGSSGGYLNDHWMLRLSNYSTSGTRAAQQAYLQRHCRWRAAATAVSGVGGSAGAGTQTCWKGLTGARCELRDLLMLPWCAGSNQTVI